jgi:hypothetical protein
MSAHHRRLTVVGLKSRSTRSGAVRTPRTRIVVRPRRRRVCPDRAKRSLPRRRPVRLSRRSSRAPWEGRQATRGRNGPIGVGSAQPLARDPPPAPGRPTAVRDSRNHRWTAREASAVRKQLHHPAVGTGVRRRFASHHYADLRIMPSALARSPHFPAQYGIGERVFGIMSRVRGSQPSIAYLMAAAGRCTAAITAKAAVWRENPPSAGRKPFTHVPWRPALPHRRPTSNRAFRLREPWLDAPDYAGQLTTQPALLQAKHASLNACSA